MVMTGYAVVTVAGLVGIRVLTELAPAHVFGEANLWLGVVSLWSSIFLTPFTSTQVKYHTEYREKGMAAVFTALILKWTVVVAFVSGAIGVLAYGLLNWVTNEQVNLALLFVALAILASNAVRNVRIGRLNAERRQGNYAGWLAGESMLIIAATAVCLWFYPSLASFLTGQLAGVGLALLIFGGILYPREPSGMATLSTQQCKVISERVKRYGLPFVPLSVMGWLSHQADRYVLAALAGPGSVGLYVAAFSLASRPILLVNGVLGDLLRPVLFEAENRDDKYKSKRVFTLWLTSTIGIGFLVLIGYWGLGHWIISLLLAEEYRSGAHAILMWIGAAYTLYGLILVFENGILGAGESRRLVATQTTGALCNILFALVLVPQHGMLGAAEASTISFGVQLLFTMRARRQVALTRVSV